MLHGKRLPKLICKVTSSKCCARREVWARMILAKMPKKLQKAAHKNISVGATICSSTITICQCNNMPSQPNLERVFHFFGHAG